MANKGDIYKVALPNGDEYNFKDKYVRENYRALNNNDFDTINVTELNSGNIINTGAARFLNTINGSISGNAATASDSAKLNGYASDTSATNNTIARRTANGYIFATYFNQSSGAETPTSSSYIIYANSDGYFRKSTVANMKTAMSLNNVENKSSATIRGEITSANVTTALGYTPVNKAGDIMLGQLTIQGSAASKPLIVRGICGYDGSGAEDALYLNYGNTTTDTVFFGNTGGGSISSNGTQYSGNAATATTATKATSASYISAFRASIASTTDLDALKGDGIKYANVQANIASNYGDGLVVAIPWSGNANYAHQLYFDDNSYVCGHRSLNNGTWSDWKKFIDESNYTDYTVKKDGTGASGTWGINISGNAATATTSNQLTENTSYQGSAFIVHTDNSIFKTYLSRYNHLGIDTSSQNGMLVLAGTWSSSTYTSELALGMGDHYGIYYRGKNNGTEQAWQVVGRFTATPTSGQVVITDGTDGGMKSSGYTIAKSVPSNAVFTDTDTKNTAGSTDTSSKIFLIGATSQAANPQTYSDNEVYTTSGVLTTKSVQVGGGSATMQYNSTLNCIDFVFAS